MHNLKNIDLDLPRDKFIVFTGLSGSGKSTLAFDTLYAEGQRRYVESLSTYARQFLGQMNKPDVDTLEGLSPAVSIEQRTTNRNPRSTVGTITEIYDYLRLLFARTGHPFCPECGREIQAQSIQDMTATLLTRPAGSKIILLAPMVDSKKGEHAEIFNRLRKSGFVRVRVDGKQESLDQEISLEKNQRHTIEVVVDRIVAEAADRFQAELEGKGIRLEMDLKTDGMALEIHPGEIQQVIQNYIVNAMQAQPDGGRIEVRSRLVDGGVRIEVRDDGPGFAEDVGEKLFSPFFSTKTTGSGLGLTICAQIIKSHGGITGAMNNPEGGAVFSFILPLPRNAPNT